MFENSESFNTISRFSVFGSAVNGAFPGKLSAPDGGNARHSYDGAYALSVNPYTRTDESLPPYDSVPDACSPMQEGRNIVSLPAGFCSSGRICFYHKSDVSATGFFRGGGLWIPLNDPSPWREGLGNGGFYGR